jgi:hypothetical protein
MPHWVRLAAKRKRRLARLQFAAYASLHAFSANLNVALASGSKLKGRIKLRERLRGEKISNNNVKCARKPCFFSCASKWFPCSEEDDAVSSKVNSVNAGGISRVEYSSDVNLLLSQFPLSEFERPFAFQSCACGRRKRKKRGRSRWPGPRRQRGIANILTALILARHSVS